ncbi:AAA family ATPase [Enterococcus termitis]
MKKIMICGPVGSGKTTFAKKLAAKEKIQLVELDNLIWERNPRGDKRFTKEQSIQLLQGTLATESWIIEGTTTQDWIKPAVAQADIILLLLLLTMFDYIEFSAALSNKKETWSRQITPPHFNY